jgi:hypothetical protein
MAWRPNEYLMEGELDNTEPGKVTGWMRFNGMGNRKVRFNLQGNFHRDIRGAKIRIKPMKINLPDAKEYMKGFSCIQKGKAGDITAGLPPQDYVDYPYIEWYSEKNGRVVLELNNDRIEVNPCSCIEDMIR